jgi:hypothetical protein
MNSSTPTSRRLLIVALMPVLLACAAARAETVNCTAINSLPVTISSQGVFCLTGNLATNISSGSAITITANNVTLDLNGWKVGGQAAGMSTGANGIISTADNVTIKNGIVRGFNIGINLVGRGGVVEDMLIDQNTSTGIYVAGQGALVRRTQVVDTGGSTKSSKVTIFSILVSGSGSSVEDNVVSGLSATGAGDEYGIYVSGQYSMIKNNIVTDDAKPTGGGISYGIIAIASQISAVENAVTDFNYGYYYNSIGLYSQNTAAGCNTPFFGSISGSSNDHD